MTKLAFAAMLTLSILASAFAQAEEPSAWDRSFPQYTDISVTDWNSFNIWLKQQSSWGAQGFAAIAEAGVGGATVYFLAPEILPTHDFVNMAYKQAAMEKLSPELIKLIQDSENADFLLAEYNRSIKNYENKLAQGEAVETQMAQLKKKLPDYENAAAAAREAAAPARNLYKQQLQIIKQEVRVGFRKDERISGAKLTRTLTIAGTALGTALIIEALARVVIQVSNRDPGAPLYTLPMAVGSFAQDHLK